MPDRSRRLFLTLSALGTFSGTPASAQAQPRDRRPLSEPPRVAADPAVIDSGLAARWQAAMSRDLGWSARFEPLASSQILDQLERGDIDVGVFLSHPKAEHLDKQGLIYERHSIARTEVLLIGPAQDPAGIRSESDAGRALTQIIAAAGAGQANWTQPAAGSPLAALADALTSGLASKGLSAAAPRAVAGPAYQLMTRLEWNRKGASAGTKVWPLKDPRLVLDLQTALSFRSRHSAGKLLVTWLQWPIAQGIVGKAQPVWQRIKP
ncbi:substrate-binding domain-containing protein [Aquabacterium sp.]|uniref:substrate-binding domain-containing protein n=1 Tax=Aquabacterium sp. TaxID=1872578 RepID=UPI002E36AA8E|nr:substrate-binding domain-containing protein [Aquabacterium sp.]HEX5312137.1 substrate-binding domain-containing protein [Aquabacterium sp.]